MLNVNFTKPAAALVLCMFTVHGVRASTLWIGNDITSPVERYTSNGIFIDQWGFPGATGTALDGMGFVYTVVPSSNDSVITKYDASGTAVASIHFTTGTDNGHGFPSWIEDMAYRSDTNTLWVSGFNGIIYNIDLSAKRLSAFDTGHTYTGIATDGTFLYTTGGFDDDTIVKRRIDGTIVSTVSTGFSGGGGIGYDASDGSLYVGYGGLVRHFDLSGTLLGSFSTPTSGFFHDGLEVGEVGSPCVQVQTPVAGSDFDLTEISDTATHVPFRASAAGGQVHWDVLLRYQTSGGRPFDGPFTDSRSFDTTSGEQNIQTYVGMGGQLGVTVASLGCIRGEEAVTITGVAVPELEITNELIELYRNGATPRLLTGIAQVESGYRHFCIPGQTCLSAQTPLYGRTDFWPHESEELHRGSHIGLMQLPLAMRLAWDWLGNAQAAAALFEQKLAAAGRNEQRIRITHIGLTTLSPVEQENMAVLLYGPFAPIDNQLTRQYYIPECRGGTVVQTPRGLACQGGSWVWTVNSAGNPGGVGYADSVRSSMH